MAAPRVGLVSTDSLSWRNSRLTGRIPELDGIRGLAILAVLTGHYLVFDSLVPRTWPAYLLAPLRLYWTGVDLFFVLSGFLIGGILYDAKDSRSYYQTFYSRRVFRIFPIYFMWVLLFLAGLYFVGPGSTKPFQYIFNRELPIWSYPLFIQNISMSLLQLWGPLWMSVTWSLAVEEQFYLLLPLLIRNLEYRGIVGVAVASILCAPISRLLLQMHGNDPIGPSTLLPCRADALGCGMLIALACRNRTAWEWLVSRRKQLCVAFLLMGCGMAVMVKNDRVFGVLSLSWIAVFYALLLLLTLLESGRVGTYFLRSRVLVRLGTVSYSIYVFHQGINGLLHAVILGGHPTIIDWSSLSVTMLSLITVVLLSALSWRLFEKPLIRHARAVHPY